jgi:hypothetical protein
MPINSSKKLKIAAIYCFLFTGSRGLLAYGTEGKPVEKNS